MSHRMWRNVVAGGAILLGSHGTIVAQDSPRLPEFPARSDLPFTREPDRLPGPPRAMGELPWDSTQPPSTLPGRIFGQPPRAMGETMEGTASRFAPQFPNARSSDPYALPGMSSPFAPQAPNTRLSDPFATPRFGLPATMPGSPTLAFPPGLTRNSGRPEEGDLPPALPGRFAPRPALDPLAAPIVPLKLGEVLASAERGYPPYMVALQERDVADGELLSSQGAFDLNFNSDSRNYPLGYYNRSVQDVFLEQPLKWNGAKVFGGYRLAQGRWPTYYNYLNTRGGGAFVAGFDLPLLRNRAIDPKRAKLIQSEIERGKVEPTLRKQRIELFKTATKSYWNWVAAGQSRDIYADLVRVAEARQEALTNQARAGAIRAIDIVDFRRILLSRQQQAVLADRRFQQATIELSLFYRDNRGVPVLIKPNQLPQEFPIEAPPDPGQLDTDMEVALRLRPEILSIRLQARKADVDRQLAINMMEPSLNLYVYTEQNLGNRAQDLGKDFRPFVMEASLLFDVPLQRRAARGKVNSASAVIRQLEIQARFQLDRIRADTLDATLAVRAAYEQLVRYRETEEVSLKLEDAEAILMREGGSNALFLNLREQATSDAKAMRVEAEAKYQSTLADLRAALGIDGVNLGPGDVTP